MARSAVKRKQKTFHAIVQVVRTEEWFVEAADEQEARTLLEAGDGHRSLVGERMHFEIDSVID